MPTERMAWRMMAMRPVTKGRNGGTLVFSRLFVAQHACRRDRSLKQFAETGRMKSDGSGKNIRPRAQTTEKAERPVA